MSQKGARKCQSVIHLSPATAERGTNINNGALPKQSKRAREDIENPTMTWESPATSEITLTQPSVLEIATKIYEQPTFELENNRAAVRLDRLADKIDRYKSHDEFLKKCIENKVTPLSYKVFLEPSIGNHDENFLKGYHDMLFFFLMDFSFLEQNTEPWLGREIEPKPRQILEKLQHITLIKKKKLIQNTQ